MILSDDMILNTDKIIFSDLLPHVQPVRSHWQPFAFRHSLGTLAITSIFSLSSYFNFHNWFTALTWKAVHPNLIPVDLLAFTFSTPLSLSMHQFHFQYNFSTPLSHSQDHFHNTTFFFWRSLSLSQYNFHFLNTTFTFYATNFTFSMSLSIYLLKPTFSFSRSLSQHHFLFSEDHLHFLNTTFSFSTSLSLSALTREAVHPGPLPLDLHSPLSPLQLQTFGGWKTLAGQFLTSLLTKPSWCWSPRSFSTGTAFTGFLSFCSESPADTLLPLHSCTAPGDHHHHHQHQPMCRYTAHLCSKMEKKKDIWWKFEIFDPQVCWGGVCLHCRHDGRRCHRGTSLAIIAFVFFIVTIVIVFNKDHHRDLIVVSRLGSC